MGDWTGGRITREWVVRCDCGSERNLGRINLGIKAEATQRAEESGWRERDRGWVCPSCYVAYLEGRAGD